MNKFTAIACAILALSISAGAFGGELEDREVIINEVVETMAKHDFDKLERLHEAYSNLPMSRTASGVLKLQLFDDGVTRVLKGRDDAGEEYYQSGLKVTREWVDKHPDSPLAYLLHNWALGAYSSYIRGYGYANTVAPQTWEVYEKLAKQRAEFLIKNAEVTSRDTDWHVAMISLAKSLGWSKDVVLRIAEDGMAKNPADYRIYRMVSIYLYPRWYGTAKELDDYINNITKRDPMGIGMELYARLYSAAGEVEYQHRLYSHSPIKWAKMKQGLELWNERYPTSWNKNIFAYQACIAGDWQTASKLVKELGDEVDLTLWQPNGRVTFESCKRWLDKPEPAAEKPAGAI